MPLALAVAAVPATQGPAGRGLPGAQAKVAQDVVIRDGKVVVARGLELLLSAAGDQAQATVVEKRQAGKAGGALVGGGGWIGGHMVDEYGTLNRLVQTRRSNGL
jgi:hypothetical protein